MGVGIGELRDVTPNGGIVAIGKFGDGVLRSLVRRSLLSLLQLFGERRDCSICCRLLL